MREKAALDEQLPHERASGCRRAPPGSRARAAARRRGLSSRFATFTQREEEQESDGAHERDERPADLIHKPVVAVE